MVGEGLRVADGDGSGDAADWVRWAQELGHSGAFVPRGVGRASVFAVSPGMRGDVTGRTMPRFVNPVNIGEIAIGPSAN